MLQLGGISEADAAWFFQQLVCAVDFCHRLGIANRDIKVGLTGTTAIYHLAPLVQVAPAVLDLCSAKQLTQRAQQAEACRGFRPAPAHGEWTWTC